jgi:hypothetical protein
MVTSLVKVRTDRFMHGNTISGSRLAYDMISSAIDFPTRRLSATRSIASQEHT